jgi:tRNA U34 5-methylaminomethyl-2-thiouridine-forming methyltransferase MnmC
MHNDGAIVVSGDGSHTLISPHFNTSYHSLNGSVTESQIVFIQSGLDYLKSKSFDDIKVFEMGFGTGLNALLSLIWARTNHIKIEYHSIEAYPISSALAMQLNYGQIYNADADYIHLHQADWNHSCHIDPNFTIHKYRCMMEEFESLAKFDVIYYDAFSPTDQPNLWDEGMMCKMYQLLLDDGILVTYCAKGSFKRALKSAGFNVENLPGPPGKREITRAVKGFQSKTLT